MTLKVRIAESAENDLETIVDYISRDSPANATKFVEDVLSSSFKLAEFPGRHAIVPGYRRPLRRFPLRGYSIYYLADKDLVEIVHVLNDAQDHRSILAN